jgi:FlaA1/EpsC-like NDP-sugar epimerase
MRILSAVSFRRMVVMTVDVAAVLSAYVLAFLLRFDFKLDPYYLGCLVATAPFAIMAYLPIAYGLGVRRGLEYSSSFGEEADVLMAAALAALLLSLVVIPATHAKFPRSVLLLWPALSVVGAAALRACARSAQRGLLFRRLGRGRTAVIVGVGDLGELVYQSMRSDRSVDYRIAAFFDDDRSKWGMRLHGATVVGGVPAMTAFLQRVRVDEIVVAVSRNRGSAVGSVADALQGLAQRPEVRIMPTIDEMLNSPRRADPRKVMPCDLLNRRVVSLDTEGIARSIEGKVVLVTGAGGTIGGELSRQVVRYKPAKIILLENHATALFYREAELRGGASAVAAVLGDVRDQALLERIFREERPQIVFHAAAHKHVHQLETNIHEGVSNNLLGTYHLARAADRYGAESFILISTDKAVRPSCVMGATKRAAEIVVSNMAHASKTRFAAVRFGNVLGSSGSVLKIFQEQIEKGQPITLTHPDVTRYFMTVEEAVGLVLQASAMAKGGEIFVLKMGEPVRIMDTARKLIVLSGLEPGRDIEIRVVGLKPGEKLAEELIEDSSGQEQSEHPEILVLRSENRRIGALEGRMSMLERLRQDAGNGDMIRALSQLVPTFIADPVHHKLALPVENGEALAADL